jgi:hypothetical protein
MGRPDRWYAADRLGGLRRFATAITLLNLLGHTVLGFEQSIATPLVALATGYGMELLLEAATAWSAGRRPRFRGGPRAFVDFLLPPHISSLAISMLLYANDRLAPVMFATAVAIASKYLFRVATGGGNRHVLNPSNFGITVTLLCFPWVGIAPPYHFTENLTGWADWILPAVIVASGSFLNVRFTRRWPLITAWLAGFVLQALARHLVLGASFTAALLPMTGVAFLLFTYYMVTDPPTTPGRTRDQVLFGAGVAAAYGALVALHVVFGLFFALSIVCATRGLFLYARSLAVVPEPVLAPGAAAPPAHAPVPAPILERQKT